MDSKLSRWCDGLMEAGWLTALIITPLFFNIHSDRVFEPDKLTLLRSIAVVMASAWLVKFVDQQAWQQRGRLSWRHEESIWKMPFVLPVTLIAIVYLISTLFSVTPSVSWAGSYQRLQGTYTTLSYIAIFGVIITTMRTRAQVRRLATIAIIVSIPIAFYGVLQHFDQDPLPWGGNTQRRIAGHMGNAIFIGAYLIMIIPLVVARIIKSFTNILNDEELSYADVIRSSIYIFTLVLQLLAIFWSQSRGPLVGILVGMFAFVLIVLVSLRNAAEDKRPFQGKDLLWSLLLILPVLAALFLSDMVTTRFSPTVSLATFFGIVGLVIVVMFVLVAMQRGWHWLWLSWILLAVVGAGWFVLFNVPSAVTEGYADTPVVSGIFEAYDAWRELPNVGRLGTVLEDDSRTGRVRVLIWEGALELLQPHEPLQFPDGSRDQFNFLRPLIGYGPESMYVAYNRFYPPELATIEARNASPDRSHNETFDALVITGVLGYLLWQWLYLSVFYYGFKWLGVLRTRRDSLLLIGLWIGVGLLVMVGFVAWRGLVYFGVAFPFGSIGGVVLYLIYYALFARSPAEEEEAIRPFQWDRLLVTALIAAVLAHYVEIHFGIAIASTRTHFFAYLGALFVLTYLMPDQAAAPVEEPVVVSKKRRRRIQTTAVGPTAYGTWGPLLLNGFMLALMLGTMGYTYITYNQPPDVTSIEQITPGSIFHQSMLINAKQDFAQSPFIFLLFILTWVLGGLLIVSEMVKDYELRFTLNDKVLARSRQQLVAGVFGAMGLVSFVWRFVFPLPDTAGATSLLGQSLLWLWGLLCVGTAVWLFFGRASAARFVAGCVALAGVVLSVPVLIGGGGIGGLVVGGVCAVLLYLVWDSTWNNSLGAVVVLAVVSLGVGLMYSFFQAFQMRYTILYSVLNPQPELPEQLQAFLIGEAEQAASMLVMYYLFVFATMIIAAFAISISRKPPIRQNGTTPAYALLAALVVVSSFIVFFTNIQIIQADIVYKRGKIYDTQASRNQNPVGWENAIAIYEAAIDRAPREDFYFLFLGRAFLELATLRTGADTEAAEVLLEEASDRLQEAQEINPLNTDHTANLARLNTRWVSLAQSDAEREERLAEAEDYYWDALSLSPQNSVIRNELAALYLSVKQDCEAGLDTYRESLEIDPFFEDTYFRLADGLVSCANAENADQDERYLEAAQVMETGLEIQATNPRAWLRLAQIYQTLEMYDEALAAYENLRQYDAQGRVLPGWNLDFILAQIYLEQGDEAQAEMMAQRSLATAPAEAAQQIQQFISRLQEGETDAESESEALPATEPYDLNGPRPLADLPPAERNNYFQSYPPFVIDPSQDYEAVIATEKGDIRVRLFAGQAPLTVNNFVYLASEGFYDGVSFHRVIDEFMAQTGDPTGSGSGGPGYQFADEVDTDLLFDRPGLLAMANSGPATNGSQFFITFVPTPHLNGLHTIFGEVIEGEAVLSEITRRDPQQSPDFEGDLIEHIQIVEAGE